MTLSEATAKRINEYLFSRGITLYKLAKDAGIPVSSLQNLYRGNAKSPTLATIYKIINALNVTIEEFFNSELFSPNTLELD